VWGLGMMLYQLVSGGVHPYSSVAGGRNSKVAALKSFVPVQLPHHLPDIPGLRSVLPTLGRIFRPVSAAKEKIWHPCNFHVF
jgi:hypothetical protein